MLKKNPNCITGIELNDHTLHINTILFYFSLHFFIKNIESIINLLVVLYLIMQAFFKSLIQKVVIYRKFHKFV